MASFQLVTLPLILLLALGCHGRGGPHGGPLYLFADVEVEVVRADGEQALEAIAASVLGGSGSAAPTGLAQPVDEEALLSALAKQTSQTGAEVFVSSLDGQGRGSLKAHPNRAAFPQPAKWGAEALLGPVLGDLVSLPAGPKGFEVVTVLSSISDGSAPSCYDHEARRFVRVRQYVPRGLATYKIPHFQGSKWLPEYDFCRQGGDSAVEFFQAIVDGGAAAAHAVAALAYANHVDCPGALSYYLHFMANIDWSGREGIALMVYHSMAAAFDRAGVSLCVSLFRKYDNGTQHFYTTLGTGASWPSLFLADNTQLSGGDRIGFMPANAPGEQGMPLGTASSHYECDYRCWSTPDCFAWTYLSKSQSCYFKRLGWMSGPSPVAGAVSGVVVRPSLEALSRAGTQPWESTVEEEVAFTGRALIPGATTFGATSHMACMLACRLTEACRAWTLSGQGVCELKGELGEALPSKGAVSGLVTRSSWGGGEEGGSRAEQ